MNLFEQNSNSLLQVMRQMMLRSLALTSFSADDESPIIIEIPWDEIIQMANRMVPTFSDWFEDNARPSNHSSRLTLGGDCCINQSSWLQNHASCEEMLSFSAGVKEIFSKLIKELTFTAVSVCHYMQSRNFDCFVELEKIKFKRGKKWGGQDDYELRLIGLVNLLSSSFNGYFIERLNKMNRKDSAHLPMEDGCTKLYSYHYWFLQIGENCSHLGRFRKLADDTPQWENSYTLNTFNKSNPLLLMTRLLTHATGDLHNNYLDNLDEGVAIWYKEPIAELKKQFNTTFLTQRWTLNVNPTSI